MKFKIDFETNTIKSMYNEFPFIMEDEVVKLDLKIGRNEVKIEQNQGLYFINYEDDKIKIKPGVYDKNIIIDSKVDETIYLPLYYLQKEEIEIFNDKQNKNNDLIKEIPNLIRHDHIPPQEKHKLINLLRKYPNVFKTENDPLSATNLQEHKIKTKTDDPIYSKNYRYPHHFKENIKEEIKKMLESKIIRPSNSPYNSPVWIVPKKIDASGKRKIRMVIDYRKLNRETIQDKYPLPNIEDLLGKLGKATIFTAMDLCSGFHQIKVEENSIPKTAFSTDQGHFEFLRMPFGLCNAPSTFMRAMNIIFSDAVNVLVYMDDIIIFSETYDEHWKHLEATLKKLEKHNLKIQLDKTEFCKPELLFLGHIISERGIEPNPEKVKAVKEFKLPKTEKEIKSFLGLTGFYRKMIPNYAKIASPMTKCLRKDQKEIDPNSYKEAFEKLKILVCSSPILQIPDFNEDFYLTTDASNYAIGAVLAQKKDGKELPVCYASRTLNKAEQNYSTTEKECLAIIWACHHFRPYLYGRKFFIYSDHKPLEYLKTCKTQNSRLIRWKLLLEDFEYDIKYINGKANKVADHLSRYPVNRYTTEKPEFDIFHTETSPLNYSQDIIDLMQEMGIEERTDITEENQNPEENQDDVSSLATQHSKESSDNRILIVDDKSRPINVEKNQIIIRKGHQDLKTEKLFTNKQRHTLEFTWPYHENDENIETKLLQIFKPNVTYGVYCSPKSNHIESENNWYDALFNKVASIIREKFITNRIKRYYKLVPDVKDFNDQKSLILDYHIAKTCHRGINETYLALKTKFYWPNMRDQITDIINKCDICGQGKYDRRPIKQKFQITLTPERPFTNLMLDTVHMSNYHIYLIVDTFSKKIFTYYTNSYNSVETMKAIKKYLVYFPKPKTITCDNGREFDNNLFKDFMKYLEIEIHFTTPNHPNSLGLLNRTSSSLLEILRLINLENKEDNEEDKLEQAVVAYNNSLNQDLKMTPNEITFGITNEMFNETPEIQEYLVHDYHKKLRQLHEATKSSIKQNKEKIIGKLNEQRENMEIPEDVFIQQQRKKKTDPKFQKGKFIDEKFQGKNKKKKKKLHPDQIKRPKKTRKKKSINKPSTSKTLNDIVHDDIEKIINELEQSNVTGVSQNELEFFDDLFEISSDHPSNTS